MVSASFVSSAASALPIGRDLGLRDERAIELDRAGLALGVEAAHELGVRREVGSTRPLETRSGENATKSRRRGMLRAASAGRSARGADRHRRLDRRRSVPAWQRRARDVRHGAVEDRASPGRRRRRPSAAARATTRSAPRDGGRGVGRGAQPPSATARSAPRCPASFGNGAAPGVDGVDDALVDVAADDLVAGERDLHRQRQPDLAQRDDDGARQQCARVSPVRGAARGPPPRPDGLQALLERHDGGSRSPRDAGRRTPRARRTSGSRRGSA